MLNLKKMLTKILTYQKNYVIVEQKTITSSLTIVAGGVAAASLNVSKSGYIPIGVVGVNRSGGGSGLLADSGFSINSDGVVQVQVYNPNNWRQSKYSVCKSITPAPERGWWCA